MMKIDLPKDFNAHLLFQYLRRSNDEISFTLEGESIFKLFFFDQKALLCKIEFKKQSLNIEVVVGQPTAEEEKCICKYVSEWFDLDTDLEPFYRIAEKDNILKPLTRQFRNLRIIRSPDLFEALCWSIIGQQINLTFAYQCKRRLIEQCNQSINYEGKKYYAFPTPAQILNIDDRLYRELKFSRQKVKYLRTVAEAIIDKNLSKKDLQNLSLAQAEARLISLQGIGQWSANYVLMRCLGNKDAFPIADVGLHNALKQQLKLDQKPTISEIREWSQAWKGWRAYATFYLWQSLL